MARNILAKRLAILVDEGLMLRRTYQEPGERAREEYVLTEAGRSLSLVIAALGAWVAPTVPGRTEPHRNSWTRSRRSLCS